MKTSRFIRLSHTLRTEDPVFPGNPPVVIEGRHDFALGDGCKTFEVRFFNHNGTHIDFPHHYVETGRSLQNYEMDELVFDQVGVVQLDVGKGEALRLQHFEAACSRLKNTECLLIKTGFQRARATADYAHGPYITRELARWLRDQLPALKCIGLDTLSITSMESFDEGQEVHRILLGGKEAPFVIEDMDFSQINSRTEIDRLFVAPWFIERVDGGPCTAFAEVQK